MHDSDSWELGRVKGDPECTLLETASARHLNCWEESMKSWYRPRRETGVRHRA